MKYVEEWIREEIEYNNKMYEQAPDLIEGNEE